jgi:hypothetical protein
LAEVLEAKAEALSEFVKDLIGVRLVHAVTDAEPHDIEDFELLNWLLALRDVAPVDDREVISEVVMDTEEKGESVRRTVADAARDGDARTVMDARIVREEVLEAPLLPEEDAVDEEEREECGEPLTLPVEEPVPLALTLPELKEEAEEDGRREAEEERREDPVADSEYCADAEDVVLELFVGLRVEEELGERVALRLHVSTGLREGLVVPEPVADAIAEGEESEEARAVPVGDADTESELDAAEDAELVPKDVTVGVLCAVVEDVDETLVVAVF